MSKKVIIITSSPRKGGNSDSLAESFANGAKESGNSVEIISLADKNIGFCKGCLACVKAQKCVINDDAAEIIGKMKEADVIVFATPVYYYSVSGQLKTMLDRSNPLYTTDYSFRKIYLLATAAEDAAHTVAGTQTAIQGWVDCYEKTSLAGTVFAGGVTNKGDIVGHPVLKEAYEMGKSL